MIECLLYHRYEETDALHRNMHTLRLAEYLNVLILRHDQFRELQPTPDQSCLQESATIQGQNPYSPLPYSVPVFLHPQNIDASNTLIANDIYTDTEGNEQLNMIANAGITPTDFSQAFEQNWANALLPYHPEYSKLVRCENELKTTFNFEGRLNDIDKWADAASQNLIDGIFSQDPFFAGTTPISKQPLKDIMEQKLNNMLVLSDCSATLSMLQVALATVNCRNKPDISDCSDVNGLLYCVSNQSSASYLSSTCADKDYAWKAFKTFYLSERKKLIDQWLDDETEINDEQILDYHVGDASRYILRFPGIVRVAASTSIGQLMEDINANPSGGANVVDHELQQQYEAACNGYATYWLSRLLSCPDIPEITTEDREWLLPKLVEICRTGSDADHPMGSSSLPPGAPGDSPDFPAVIQKFLDIKNIPVTWLCHPYLIEAPKPYDKQVSPVTMPVVSKPSDCQCDRIEDLKVKFNQSGVPGTFSQYLEYTHGTYIAQGSLDTLLALCDGSFPCNFIDNPIQLPVTLQCSGGNEVMPATCINCEKLHEILSGYVQKFGIEGVPISKPQSDKDYEKNISFELFANNATGFRKTWVEWLSFKNLCTGTGVYPCQTLDSVLQLFYQSPAYLANSSGTQCRQDFANFFNSALGVSYSFDQILNLFVESCQYVPDVCNPRITCTKLNTIANEFYNLYGTSVSTNTNCSLLFTNHFNSKVQMNYNYDQIREIYKLVCGCTMDFCQFPNDILLNNAYDAFKDYYANSTLPLLNNCQDLFVTFSQIITRLTQLFIHGSTWLINIVRQRTRVVASIIWRNCVRYL